MRWGRLLLLVLDMEWAGGWNEEGGVRCVGCGLAV